MALVFYQFPITLVICKFNMYFSITELFLETFLPLKLPGFIFKLLHLQSDLGILDFHLLRIDLHMF